MYKLIGPVLVKQDQTEAKTNVDKRLEFIRSEMYDDFVFLCMFSLYKLCCSQKTGRRSDQGYRRESGEEKVGGGWGAVLLLLFVDSSGSWENYRRLFNNTANRLLDLSILV